MQLVFHQRELEALIKSALQFEHGFDADSVTLEIKATRGELGFTVTADIDMFGGDQDHAGYAQLEQADTDANQGKLPLNIVEKIQEARQTPAPTPVVEQDTAPEPAVEAEVAAKPTPTASTEEQPVKRRGRPPGSKNKATVEAEATEVTEAKEPTPTPPQNNIFSRMSEENASDEANTQVAEVEVSQEEQLAAEAERTEPANEVAHHDVAVEENDDTPVPTEAPRSLFAALNRPKND